MTEVLGSKHLMSVHCGGMAIVSALSLASMVTGAGASDAWWSGGDGLTVVFAHRNAIVLDLGPNTAVQENTSITYLPTQENTSNTYLPIQENTSKTYLPIEQPASVAYRQADGTTVLGLRKRLATRRLIKQQEHGRQGLICGMNANSDDWDMDDDYTTPDDDTDDKRAGDPVHSARHVPSTAHDIEVQKMLAEASLLHVLNKVASENSWSMEHSEVIALEYMRALYVLKDAGPPMVPSHDVDLLWHEHILNTKQYAIFCASVFGRFLHHEPSFTDSEKAALRPKYSVFLDHYAERFGPPNPSAWPSLDDSSCDGTCGPPDYCSYTCNDNMD